MLKRTFDLTRCNCCGLCIRICPTAIITANDTGIPSVAADKESRCTVCGQCEAVCPEEAIDLADDALIPAEPLALEHGISAEQIKTYFLSRRSTRHFALKPVDHTIFEQLIDIARHAPSGINRHPVKWVVMESPVEVKHLTEMVIDWMRQAVENKHPFANMLGLARLIAVYEKGSDPISRRAPHLIIAYGEKSDRMAPTDATIALAHIELAAPALGLGACWAGYFNIAAASSEAIRERLGLPENNVPLGTLMIGIPKFRFSRLPKRNRADVIWK